MQNLISILFIVFAFNLIGQKYPKSLVIDNDTLVCFKVAQAKQLAVWNEERKHYDFGDLDWDEFWQVVKGHGPCNKQRIDARVKACNEGQWVRDAAMAYAEKQESKLEKQAI
jgi:hypothetical protein